MAIGHFIRAGDKTTCGGTVLEGDNQVKWRGVVHAREGDRVTCGKDGKVYLIVGGIAHMLSRGRKMAGTLDSASSCPCGSLLIHSLSSATYNSNRSATSSGSTPGGTAAPFATTRATSTSEPARSDLQGHGLKSEEEKKEDIGITLRLGLFFDGTGNNQANSALTEQCRREDRQQFDEEALSALISHCARYGYRDPDEGGFFRKVPDNSYGNAPSNVAHLSRLYQDNTTIRLGPEADTGYVPVYLEGIGTTSGGSDSLLPAQASGRGDTGILHRVAQSPDQIRGQIRRFLETNPGIQIRALEFDLFGFSRGAAAARHFANEVLKPDGGLLAEVLRGGQGGLARSFDWQRDTRLNFIGLFDTVAATVDPLRGDWSPANADNPGINLYLPPGCARKVVQLVAGSERRWNFALNSVAPHHQEISLPGVHSDIGGGYPPLMEERLLASQPRLASERPGQPLDATPAWLEAQHEVSRLQSLGLPGDGEIRINAWPVQGTHADQERTGLQALVGVVLQRKVRGELSRVALRAMRELGVKHGVPFDVINDDDQRFELPADLRPIAEKILAYVQGAPSRLNADDQRHLWARYIHLSAHWTPSKGLLISKPAPNQRLVFNNKPQAGYRQ
ncbi:phospholipase effector Tle1 domain-containing protein [Pseudomonas sp. USHLN015]|uniref:phospholipase effector Tle1 domain-containing protein n=1 Tax=Pseudomonas sp. USHLN015 TaxID=3081296 RepID=UPI00301D8F28